MKKRSQFKRYKQTSPVEALKIIRSIAFDYPNIFPCPLRSITHRIFDKVCPGWLIISAIRDKLCNILAINLSHTSPPHATQTLSPCPSFSTLKMTSRMDTIKDNYSQSTRRSFHEVVQPCFPGNRKTTLKHWSICLLVQTHQILTIERFPAPHPHDEISQAMNHRFHLIQMKITIIRSEVE